MEIHALIPPPPETDAQLRRRQHRPGGAPPAGSADVPLSANHTTCRLAHRPESVGHARRIVGSLLHRWQVTEDAAASVLLVVSELVTNAVEHAQPPLALHVLREQTGRRVWVGITDGGPSPHKGAWAASCAQDEHGRGLDIVDTLATAHGTRSHEDGATHWARLPAADRAV
ncbi:ATP-binding protein [Streptomyces sp. NPDC001219]